jgi:hypothetical protein
MKIILHKHRVPQRKCQTSSKLAVVPVVPTSCGAAEPSPPAPGADGISCATAPGKRYLPAEQVGTLLQWKSGMDKTSGRLLINDRSILPSAVWRLLDGTVLVALNDLDGVGASLVEEADGRGLQHSSRYDSAPMPWSVRIRRHVFIHGFRHVPKYPASRSPSGDACHEE